MTKRVLLGMLTPSSNTALEPITTAMLAELPEVSAHFSRFKVTEIALSNGALAQFDNKGVPRPYLAEALPQLNADSWRVFPDGRASFRTDPEWFTDYMRRPTVEWEPAGRAEAAE